MLHADRWADIKRQLFAFCKFARAPKKVIISIILRIYKEHKHAPFSISGTTANSKHNFQLLCR